MKHFIVTLPIITLFLIKKGVVCQGSSCPVVGTELSPRKIAERSTSTRLFMNFHKPALCNGTVIGWRYCYYHPGGTILNSAKNFSAKFLVYRGTSGVYKAISSSFYTVSLLFVDLSVFECRTVTLNRNQQFQIQQNDIIGGCIIRNATLNPLYIVGNVNTGGVYQLDREGFKCTEELLQSVDAQSLALREDNTLLLSAITAHAESEMMCKVGNNPPSSTLALKISGTYLNTEFPAECDGVITAWHYCYYPRSVSANQRTYTANVALWHYDNSSHLYNLVDGSVTLIQLQPVNTLATIYCTQLGLSPVNYTKIRRGDLMGVLLPSQDPIPLIGNNSDSNIMISRQLRLTNLTSSELRPERAAMHLYAYVDLSTPLNYEDTEVPETTTVTTSVSTPVASVTTTVLLILLVLLVIITAVVITKTVAVHKKKKKKKRQVNFMLKQTPTCDHEVGASSVDAANVDYGEFHGGYRVDYILTVANTAYGHCSRGVVVDGAVDVNESETAYEYVHYY